MDIREFNVSLDKAGAFYADFVHAYQQENGIHSPTYIPIGQFLRDFTNASDALAHAFTVTGTPWEQVYDNICDQERDEKYRQKHEMRFQGLEAALDARVDPKTINDILITPPSCTCSLTAMMREGCPRLQGKLYCHEGD